MKRLRWLTPRGLRAIHDELIARYGGLPGLRDPGALESAVARPGRLATYRSSMSVPKLAAACAWGLLKNHPFLDGNKRIALAALVVFLDVNEWDWTDSEVEETTTVLEAAEGKMSEEEWSAWVERKCKTRR